MRCRVAKPTCSSGLQSVPFCWFLQQVSRIRLMTGLLLRLFKAIDALLKCTTDDSSNNGSPTVCCSYSIGRASPHISPNLGFCLILDWSKPSFNRDGRSWTDAAKSPHCRSVFSGSKTYNLDNDQHQLHGPFLADFAHSMALNEMT